MAMIIALPRDRLFPVMKKTSRKLPNGGQCGRAFAGAWCQADNL